MPWEGFVFVGTIGYPRGGPGAMQASSQRLEESAGSFDTIKDPWRFP